MQHRLSLSYRRGYAYHLIFCYTSFITKELYSLVIYVSAIQVPGEEDKIKGNTGMGAREKYYSKFERVSNYFSYFFCFINRVAATIR